ncbi:MAG: CPBP family intramembrane metalloprotease, partial [Candidatus Heimdallarchaeota archaeon]
MKDFSRLNWVLTNFRPAIFVIFLLSAYSLTQLVIGSAFLFLFPTNFFSDPTNYAFFSLIIMLLSSTLLIAIIMKWIPLSSQKKPLEENQIPLLFLLLIILILSVSIIEILVTFIDFGLDLINIAPSQSSPYDDFFITPLNILVFAILATTVGPIFEELVFRRFTISVMLKQCESKVLVVCMSALIFSLSHTATNLLESVRYAILHIIATFIIGIALGIIFLQWGLKYAIIFHSFWNFFSLIIQL